MKIDKSYVISLIKRHTTTFVILLYAVINIFFVPVLWKELLFDNSTSGAVYGEIFATEINMEKVYQNILDGKNPFSPVLSMLYPFGYNFVTTDSGNGFLFLFTRPFLSTHQSYFILTALALFMSNVGMFLLLKKLNVRTSIAVIIGLAFGYMTFIQPRVGQMTYYHFYPFAWFYFTAISAITANRKNLKILNALLASLFLIFSLYLNLYYFVSLLVSIALVISYFIFFDRRKFFRQIQKNILSILVFVIGCGLFILPWFLMFIDSAKFEELPNTPGWGGAIEFSSDLFGYFIPSIYSFFFGSLSLYIGRHVEFAYGIFENFSYPGIIILGGFAFLAVLFFRKKVSPDLKKRIAPFFFPSFIFWILTLGPFLHIAGRWGIVVEENIRIVIPMPYILFHYLPFMANIRSPGRLMAIFIFFAYIVVALVIDHNLKKKSARFIRNTIIILSFIFIIDHYFQIQTPDPHAFPYKLYDVIRADKQQVTVMEIPSVVRDGFTYFGENGGLDFMIGQQYHGKPVMGGYFGRVPHYKRLYYEQNPFLGYIGRLMDIDIKNNGSLDRSDKDLKPWQTLNVKQSIDAIDFLDIGYVLLKQDLPYRAKAEIALKSLEYKPIGRENNYTLWYRKPKPREFLAVKPGSPGDEMFLGSGWNTRDEGFRWAGKKTSVLFKVEKSRPTILTVTAASFFRPRKAEVYINKQYVKTMELDTKEKTYTFPISRKIKQPITTVYFLFDGYDIPAKVIPGSSDKRELSAKFMKVGLK